MQPSQPAKLSTVDEAQYGTRSCRVAILTNGMRVVMTSDLSSALSAASMSVRVGSFMDPEDIPGLAHLLEHVLFLGTEKYPNNGEFRTFLAERGGATNANTSSTVSTFHYYVRDEHGKEALARFSEFFRSPLLSADTVEEEVEIVHSEFESMLYSDPHRQLQVMRGTSSKQNPFSRILIGTRDTLLQDRLKLHSRLKCFFEEHYSANLMNLTVLSSQPLDAIESWILEFFSAVPNRHRPLQIPMSNNAFDSVSCLKKIHRICSVQGYRNLSLMFEINHDELRNCKVRTNDVIACLMRNQDRFQYLERLRAKGLASNYTVVPFEGTSYLQLIAILTESGVAKVNEIILLTFKYLNTVRMSSESEIRAAFEEASHEYPDLVDLHPEELCQHFSNTMAEMVGIGKNLLESPTLQEPCMKQVMDGLQQLRLDQCRIDLLYPWEELRDRPQNVFVEPFYGTEYSVESLHSSLIEKLHHHERYASKRALWSLKPNAMKINKLIASRFQKFNCLLKPSNKFIPAISRASLPFEDLDQHPQNLLSTSLVDLWHCSQNRSSASISLMFQSCEILDCQTLILGRLFVKIANVLISKSLHRHATEAGYRIEISTGNFPGFVVHCSGSGDKISLLMEAIAKILRLSRYPKKSVYRKAFVALLREIREQRDACVTDIAERQLFECLLEYVYPKHEAESSLVNVDRSTLKGFTRKFFHNGHWTILATGGISSETAIDIGSSFTDLTAVGAVLKPPRLTALPPGAKSIVNQFAINADRNSAVTAYLLLAESNESCHSKAIALVLIHLLAAPIFEQLRTQEKLGYVVQSKPQLLNDVIGLSITVQSERFSPDYIFQRINNAIGDIERIIRDITPKTVSNIRKAAADALRTEFCHETIWENVLNHCPALQQDDILRCIPKVTKDELVQLYWQRLGLNAKMRRQMVSMVYGHERQKTDMHKIALIVDEDSSFRKSSPAFFHQSAKTA